MKTRRRFSLCFQSLSLAWLAGLALVSALLACNLPVKAPASSGQTADQDQFVLLFNQFYPMVQGVTLNDTLLVIDYQPAMLELQETSLVNTIQLIGSAALQTSQADQVQVILYSMTSAGVPIFSIQVDAGLARQYARGEIEAEVLLEACQMEDLRTPELKLSQELNDQGYQDVEVGFQENGVLISVRQPAVNDNRELLQSWLPIFNLAADNYPAAQNITLRISGSVPSEISLRPQDIRAFRS